MKNTDIEAAINALVNAANVRTDIAAVEAGLTFMKLRKTPYNYK